MTTQLAQINSISPVILRSYPSRHVSVPSGYEWPLDQVARAVISNSPHEVDGIPFKDASSAGSANPAKLAWEEVNERVEGGDLVWKERSKNGIVSVSIGAGSNAILGSADETLFSKLTRITEDTQKVEHDLRQLQ